MGSELSIIIQSRYGESECAAHKRLKDRENRAHAAWTPHLPRNEVKPKLSEKAKRKHQKEEMEAYQQAHEAREIDTDAVRRPASKAGFILELAAPLKACQTRIRPAEVGIYNPQRTTSTSRIASRARKNLIDAKSRKRFSMCRLLNTRCSRGDFFSDAGRPGGANFTSCISSMSVPVT